MKVYLIRYDDIFLLDFLMEVLNTLNNIIHLIFSAVHGGMAQLPSQAVSYTYIGLYWPYFALQLYRICLSYSSKKVWVEHHICGVMNYGHIILQYIM